MDRQNEVKPYKGFLLIRCEDCGKVKAYCARRETNEYRCTFCGGITLLEDLKMMHMNCNKCGGSFRYRTNLDDPEFTGNCLNCDAEVDMRLSRRGDTYVTIQ